MNGRASKRKGSDFERAVVRQAQVHRLPAERAYASNGRALGLSEGVDLTIADLPIQAKRRKRLPEYLVPAPEVYGVVTRADRGETLAVIRLHDLLDLIGKARASQQCEP